MSQETFLQAQLLMEISLGLNLDVKMTDPDVFIQIKQIPLVDLTNDDEPNEENRMIALNGNSLMESIEAKTLKPKTSKKVKKVRREQIVDENSTLLNKLNFQVDEAALLGMLRLKWSRPHDTIDVNKKRVYGPKRKWVKKKGTIRPITLDNPYFHQNLRKNSAGSSIQKDSTTPNFLDIVKNTFWNFILKDNKK